MSTTITISKETKKLLSKLKGNKTWDDFLRELALKYKSERDKKILEKLRESADQRDLSYEEVRLKLSLLGD